MQIVENDMDELFRKAVDQVPLHPVNSRWNEIVVKLTGNPTISTDGRKKINDRGIHRTGRKVLLTAIFIILLATFINHEEKNSPSDSVSKTRFLDKDINAGSRRPVKEKMIITSYKSGEGYKTGAGTNRKYPTEVLLSQNQSGVPLENQQTATEAVLTTKRNENSSQFMLNAIPYFNIPQTKKPIEWSESSEKTGSLTPRNLNSYDGRRFYLGLAVGPILSQIKTQGYNKPGFDFGLLIGYKINRKISVETGLLHTTQYYSASGKYYNQVTGGNTTHTLEGSRTAFEIPFKLNYNIFHSRTGNFFISGGFSSYVGANDKIVINVGDNTPNPPQKLDYGVASYLPSYLDFSIAYERSTGKSARIRLEPYLEIPMSSTSGNTIMNAGGSLQIVNTGLHIVITRFIR